MEGGAAAAALVFFNGCDDSSGTMCAPRAGEVQCVLRGPGRLRDINNYRRVERPFLARLRRGLVRTCEGMTKIMTLYSLGGCSFAIQPMVPDIAGTLCPTMFMGAMTAGTGRSSRRHGRVARASSGVRASFRNALMDALKVS